MTYEMGFREGAEWADRTMIDNACDYLEKNIHRIYNEESEFIQRFITDFKKAMED